MRVKFWIWARSGFPGGSDGKESVCNAGDPGSIPGLGRSPGEGHSNPLQYSCLEILCHGQKDLMGLQSMGCTIYRTILLSVSQVVQVVKNTSARVGNARDVGSIPGSGRCPGGRHGSPLQDSCLEYPMDRGAWWATVHGVAKSRTQLSD